MADDQFNKEMDAYIRSQRQKQKGSVEIALENNSTSEPKQVKNRSGRIVEYEDGESLWDKILDFFVGGYEERPEEEEQSPPRDELSPREKKKLAQMEGTQVDVEEVSDEEFEDYDDYEELEVPEPSFFDKLLQFFGVGEDMYHEAAEDAYGDIEDFDPDEYAEEESDRLMWEEDVKETMKIAHKWIDKLPDDKKKEFKESEDFERYRELLDNLGLLKK